ncbi:hypothetical protein ACFWJM_05945 [Streptomyces sp. NPDC127077]|uniref:hypothetical protein n=1 Tax=Streptomyces sp. NPDC127077 TaxID=3347131 RepID=UPI003658E849
MAQLIRTPQARVSFLAPMGDGAHGHDSGARLLIWGLCAMLEKVTGDAYFSYSSLETHDFTGRLRLTCVPHWHVGHEDRHLVRIGFDSVLDDEAQELARDLVGFFLQAPDRPELIHDWLGWSLDHDPHNSQQGMEALADALRGARRRWLSGARDTTRLQPPGSQQSLSRHFSSGQDPFED